MILGSADYAELARRRHALRAFAREAADAAAAAGITAMQEQLLVLVAAIPEPGPRITDIAARLLVAHHTAVGLVNRAERAGLAERRRDASDVRAVRVQLTGNGREVLARLQLAHLRELTELPRLLSWARPALEEEQDA